MIDIPEFADAFFYHELRGAKGGSHHNPHDDVDANLALQETFQHIDFTDISDADLEHRWFVDVALEIHHPGHVVHWRADQHMPIMRHVMPSATPARVTACANGGNFEYDACMQLSDVAGFRVATPTAGRDDQVKYINVYSTEKSVHYQLHPGQFLRAEPKQLMPGEVNHLLQRLNKWTEAFLACMGDDDDPPQEASARLEVRVSARQCGVALRNVPYLLLSNSCISVPGDIWWSFKYWRVFACYLAIKNMTKSPASQRVTRASLQFGAMLTHILNGTLYR
ncbi:uncharacterized protein B0H18DRAFT_872410, partial [Fomitopsis serialis]|uniref:uncharacterized protein n=1 Tax=Fomitopsis serialis TaxID=139415 RepID=UPI002007F5D3